MSDPQPTALHRPAVSRRIRLRWMLFGFWRRKIVFILGACLIGLVSAGFARAADLMQRLFEHWRETAPVLVMLWTVIGFTAAAVMTSRWFPAARGSGIP